MYSVSSNIAAYKVRYIDTYGNGYRVTSKVLILD